MNFGLDPAMPYDVCVSYSCRDTSRASLNVWKARNTLFPPARKASR